MQCHNVVGWRFSPDRGEHSDTTMRRASHCRCLQHATRVETSVKPMPTTCTTMLKLLALRLVALLLETQLQAPMTTRVHIQQPMSQQMMTSSAQHAASLARGGTMHGKLSTSAWACRQWLTFVPCSVRTTRVLQAADLQTRSHAGGQRQTWWLTCVPCSCALGCCRWLTCRQSLHQAAACTAQVSVWMTRVDHLGRRETRARRV